MTDTTGDIEPELERVLPDAGADLLPELRDALDTNHWYGDLSLRVHDALAGRRHDGAAAAAAGVELLHAYCRVRGQLLVQLSDDIAHSLTADPTRTLLATDHLYAAAYAAFAHANAPTTLFTTAIDTSQRITTAFTARYTDQAQSMTEPGDLVDGTTGALGEAAAVAGAVLADATGAQRDAARTLGRGLGALESVRRADESEPRDRPVTLPNVDETQLNEYADRRRADVSRALDTLESSVDVRALQELVPE